MFLMGIKSQRFRESSFSKFYYTVQKKPFATPRTFLYFGPKPVVIDTVRVGLVLVDLNPINDTYKPSKKIPLRYVAIPYVCFTTQIYQGSSLFLWVYFDLNIAQDKGRS